MIGLTDYLFHICHLNITIFKERTAPPVYIPEGPLPLETLQSLPLRELLSDMEKGDDIRHLADNWGFQYLYVRFLRDEYILGPFVSEDQKQPKKGRQFSRFKRLPVLNPDQLQAIITAASLFVSHPEDVGKARAGDIVEIHNPATEEERTVEYETIEEVYRGEAMLRDLIARGDKKNLQQVLEYGMKSLDFSHRLPQNPLRLQKNINIIINTIGRHAAEKGGLPIYLLHSLSDEYAIRIERCRSIDELEKLTVEMCLGYCDAVRNYAIGNHSYAIVKVATYILQNLESQLKLETLAEVAGYNPSHLSKQFKKETGKTISRYIQEKRITEAQWLLSHGEDPVTDIALTVGFEDAAYFSRVFRNITGFSPLEFRRKRGSATYDGLPGAL